MMNIARPSAFKTDHNTGTWEGERNSGFADRWSVLRVKRTAQGWGFPVAFDIPSLALRGFFVSGQ